MVDKGLDGSPAGMRHTKWPSQRSPESGSATRAAPRHTHPEQWGQRFIAFLSDALAIDGGQESS